MSIYHTIFLKESLIKILVFTFVSEFEGSPHPLSRISSWPPKGWWIPSRASQQWSSVAASALGCCSLSGACENRGTWVYAFLVGAQDASSRGNTLSPGSSFPTCDPNGISRAPQQAGSKEGICRMASTGYPVGLCLFSGTPIR